VVVGYESEKIFYLPILRVVLGSGSVSPAVMLGGLLFGGVCCVDFCCWGCFWLLVRGLLLVLQQSFFCFLATGCLFVAGLSLLFCSLILFAAAPCII
jgi:hypothetical protein